jgi:hypothetical protein
MSPELLAAENILAHLLRPDATPESVAMAHGVSLWYVAGIYDGFTEGGDAAADLDDDPPAAAIFHYATGHNHGQQLGAIQDEQNECPAA